jgi:hypothetical protein
MLATINRWNTQKALPEEERKISLAKTTDGDMVFFKNQYDTDTGEMLPQKVMVAFTLKDLNQEINTHQDATAILKAFKTEVIAL